MKKSWRQQFREGMLLTIQDASRILGGTSKSLREKNLELQVETLRDREVLHGFHQDMLLEMHKEEFRELRLRHGAEVTMLQERCDTVEFALVMALTTLDGNRGEERTIRFRPDSFGSLMANFNLYRPVVVYVPDLRIYEVRWTCPSR